MATKTTFNAKNLEALGAERLAALLIGIVKLRPVAIPSKNRTSN
jgi:hypothetical protein